jgi:hypothetical protein
MAVIVAAVALSAPAPLFAQSATVDEPPRITAGIERLKTSFESVSGGISVEGFLDLRATTRRAGRDGVTIGDFELDLARDLGKNVHVAIALVGNDEGAGLAAGFVDFHLFRGLIAAPGRSPEGIHLQVGRFDVPFGNDWQYLASRDRIESNAPLTTELLMDGGYNDTGVRVIGGSAAANFTAFILRGEGRGKVLGARLGFKPFVSSSQLNPRIHRVEAGLSLLRDVDRAENPRATFIALDAEAQIGRCRFRMEHVRKHVQSTQTKERTSESSGWHITAAVDAGQIRAVSLTPFARYEAVGGYGIEATKTARLTAGLNTSLFSVVMLKLEYQQALGASQEHSLFAQLVMVF